MKLDFDIVSQGGVLDFEIKNTKTINASGGIGEDVVRDIVAKATADLQPKRDETLKTQSKEIVGAINELHEREDKQGLSEEQVKEVVRATAVTQESDPTVPDWAKQAKKPTYSYEEIKDKPDFATAEQVAEISEKVNATNNLVDSFNRDLSDLTDKTDELEEYSIREVSLNLVEDNELSVELKDKEGNVISSAETTLPMPDLSDYVKNTDRNQFVKDGVVGNDIPLTDDEKASACDWFGALQKPSGHPTGTALLQVTYNVLTNTVTYSYATVGLDSGNVATYQSNATDMSAMYGNGTTIYVDTPKGKKQAANKEYVDGLVGDINTALDELHAYAQSLVGGGVEE